jgi:glycerophosphoryl diester phosphodiesterase
VHMTADGQVVVSHDPSGRRMAGVGAEIRRSMWEDVARWDAGYGFLAPDGSRPFAGAGIGVPTLEQVVVEFPGVPLNVDLKQREPDMVAVVLGLLRRLRAEDRVLLASFHLRNLVAVRALGYGGPTALSLPEVAALRFTPRQLFRLLPLTGDAAQIPVRAGRVPLATPGFIRKCHALGLRVDYWTINDPDQARHLLDLGADGIMTDDPAAVGPAVMSHPRRAA